MPDSPPRPPRIPLVDVARGVALVAMVVYHFAWDLAYHGFVAWGVAEDPAWRAFAMSIAGSFLFLTGVSLSLSARGGLDRTAYAWRLLKIAAAAAVVSAATRVVFPDAWVFFGILHMIVVAGLVGLPFLRLPVSVTLAAALGALVLPLAVGGGVFDAPPLAFLGLASQAPRANDFVPVFPWLAPALAGIAAGRLVADGRVALPAEPLRGGLARGLAVSGRWTLPVYLVHQPVLFGLVAAAAAILPADREVERARFVEACEAGCGIDPAACRAFCGCVAEAMDGTTFWSVRGGDPEMSSLVATAAQTCSPGDAPLD